MLRAALLVVATAALAAAHYGDQPTPQDYDNLAGLERIGILPWPHGSNTPPYRKLTPAQIDSLGQQYFSSVPFGQNASMMAEVLYDWSQPDYRRLNFPLTVPGNVSALAELIDLWPIGQMPYVPQMFNLTGTDIQENDAQLKRNFDTIEANSASEAAVVDYALYTLSPVQYNDPKAPQVLYRGGGRDVVFYCNQFGSTYGMSIDDCVAQLFTAGSSITVGPFWSTTPDATVIAHYRGLVQYNILPNPSVRDHWLAREIDDFSTETSALEWLYPHGAGFDVINKTCDTSTGSPFWNIFLRERGFTDAPAPAPAPGPADDNTQCVSAVAAAQDGRLLVPHNLMRFFD